MLSIEALPRDANGSIEGRWALLLNEPVDLVARGAEFVEGQAEPMGSDALERMVAIFGELGARTAIAAARVVDGAVETVPPLADVGAELEAALNERTPRGVWRRALVAAVEHRVEAALTAGDNGEAGDGDGEAGAAP